MYLPVKTANFRELTNLDNKVITKQSMIVYMFSVYENHIDYSCNVLNLTGLSEDCANEFNLYKNNQDWEVLDEVFDLACDIDSYLIKKGFVNE